MRKIIITLAVLTGLMMPTELKAVDGVQIDNASLKREDTKMVVDMNMDLSGLKVSSNRAVLLTPQITDGVNTIDLKSVGVYGSRRYIYYERKESGMLSGTDEMTYKASNKPNELAYKTAVPYESWMSGAQLVVTRKDYACCNKMIATETTTEANYFDRGAYMPQLVYSTPVAVEEKSDNLEGSANVQFPVNKVTINPTLANNGQELGKIYATIDSVRKDKDITITGIWLKGYASPEGNYAANAKLAQGRTEAIRKYIKDLYNFDDNLMHSESEPEDWEGARKYVASSAMVHRDEILKIIDTEKDADKRESLIKKNYPEEYSHMLTMNFPTLRHTDYRVSYTIRRYSDVEEIKRVFAENPHKLSLNELYLAAQAYEPQSIQYNKIFKTAVAMYPNDEVANLNAANVAMNSRQLDEAAEYLSKAGNSAQAEYARGVLATLQGDYTTATEYLTRAKAAGVSEAADALEVISKF